MHLTGIELLDWIGLRRVTEGGVALRTSGYLHWGRKVPCYLPEVFSRFIETELTGLLDADNEGLRRMVVTPAGRDRYENLSMKRGLFFDPEQPSGGLLGSPPVRPLSRLRPDGGLNHETIQW